MENYPLNHANNPANFAELLSRSKEYYGTKDMFRENDGDGVKATSAQEFERLVYSIGSAFLDMGLLDGKVALIGDPSVDWIAVYFATVTGGGVIVPMDRELPENEIANILCGSGAGAVVFSPSMAAVMDSIKPRLDGGVRYICTGGGPGNLDETAQRGIDLGFDAYLAVQTDPEALATLLYTSGTTGKSKGVMLSQKNILQCARGANELFDIHDVSMLVLPLHHSYGFALGIVQAIAHGTTICVSGSPRRFFQNLLLFAPESMFLVPAYVELIYKRTQAYLKEAGLAADDAAAIKKFLGGNLTLLICGGAPLPKFYCGAMRGMGVTLIEGYGITECSPLVSVNRERYYADGSVGIPITCCEVSIRNEDSGGEGEIWVRGGNVMLGYYNNESATAEVMDGDWFDTGDIGHVDGGGFLYITGRKKNLIVLSNGKNVYPEEIEDYLLAGVPQIKEAVVYAREESGVGETVLRAELFLDEALCSGLSENELRGVLDAGIYEVNKALPGYKQVCGYDIRESEFEKTTKKSIKRFAATK